MNDNQREINKACRAYYDAAMTECGKMPWVSDNKRSPWKRLRSCSAEVLETPNFFILRSYNTVVAVIDKMHRSTWDVLRMVYGYTATSAQHITKFTADYGNGKRYTWREIPNR
nr:MAG TPA: hypothetical protein [Caudoviricetes sp.]